MTNWNPDIDLVRLLEALGQEIAATTDDEVRQASAAYGYSVRVAAGEIRRLLAPMIDDPTDPGEVPSEPDRELPRAQSVRNQEQRQRH
jgi:hypothetical protein